MNASSRLGWCGEVTVLFILVKMQVRQTVSRMQMTAATVTVSRKFSGEFFLEP